MIRLITSKLNLFLTVARQRNVCWVNVCCSSVIIFSAHTTHQLTSLLTVCPPRTAAFILPSISDRNSFNCNQKNVTTNHTRRCCTSPSLVKSYSLDESENLAICLSPSLSVTITGDLVIISPAPLRAKNTQCNQSNPSNLLQPL